MGECKVRWRGSKGDMLAPMAGCISVTVCVLVPARLEIERTFNSVCVYF